MRQKQKNKNGVTLRLSGPVAEQMERFFEHRIRSPEARDLVYREAEDAFRNRIDDSSGSYGIWQGEFWGKWMIGAVQFCRYSGDEKLKKFIREGVCRLIAMQEPSGYLGTYRDPMNVFPADPAQTKVLLGWPCDWNWNIWCRKYTLWGLLEAWSLLKEEEILQAAERLADHLIDSLHANGIRIGATGTFAGIPSGSILKPMVLLFRAGGKVKFLEFAKEIVADWRRPDGLCPNLIVNALSGKPVHEWYPEPAKWAKAYEMMSCFEGILELYRVTGERELLEAAIRFRQSLKQTELNALFSVGFNDIFANGRDHLNAISEPCDVIHWMRLCSELFRESGDPSCLDDFEMAFYNPFLAAVYRDGCWGARGVRSHGRHLTVLEQAKMHHNHCCVNNIPRGFMNLAEMAACKTEEGVSVHFYTDFELETEELSLRISGDYLASGKVHLQCRAERAVNLRLRIPGWAISAKLQWNGECLDGEGCWFKLRLPEGVSEISLSFERRLEIREHPGLVETDEWFRSRWIEPGMEDLFRTERGATLVYGPLLLARSKWIGNTEQEMFSSPLPSGFSCTLRPERSDAAMCVFEADFGAWKTRVCDYASAGNAILKDPRFFNIFF